MKDIKDYLHLYLGCECMIGDLNWKRPEILPEDIAPFVDLDFGKPFKTKVDFHVLQHYSHKTTLILRPLSDMTKEESYELEDFIWENFQMAITRNKEEILKMFDAKYLEYRPAYSITVRAKRRKTFAHFRSVEQRTGKASCFQKRVYLSKG